MSKLNNNVIVTSYDAPDNKFIGDKKNLDTVTLQKYKKEFAGITKQILKDNPDVSFDYSHYPSLTISHNYNAVAVLTPSIKDGEYDFKNAYGVLLTDAFRSKDTIETMKNILPKFGVDFDKMRPRNDLGEKQELVNASFDAIQDGVTDFSNFTNVRQGMKPVAKVVQEAVAEDDFSFTNPDLMKNENDLKDANEARKNLNEDFNPQNVEDVSKKTKLHEGIKQSLHDQNGRAADEDNWLERRMKELDLYFNHHKTPAYKSLPLPFIHDVTIHDKHNRELLSWRTGGGSIKIHEAGIFHEAAGKLAAEAAYKKFGHGKVHFNVSNSAKERYKDNMGQICEQKLNQLVAAGFEPEQIVFPKEWQYLVTMKANEMKNLAEFSQATPEQIAEAAKAEQDFKAKNQDIEGVKDSPEKPATPVADGVPTKAAPVDSSPVVDVTIPDVPTAGVVPEKAAPATQEAPAQKKTIINKCTLVKTKSHEDPTKEKYNLIGVKGEVESMSGPTLQKVFNGLTKAAGIDISQIAGTWLSDGQVFTYGEFKKAEAARLDGMSEEQIKESKDDYNFQGAYDVLKEMKEVAKLALATPETVIADVAVDVAVDFAIDDFADVVVDAEPVLADVPAHIAEQIPDDDFDFERDILQDMDAVRNSIDVPAVEEPAKPSVEDTERFLAEAFGMPEVLESPEYADLQEARATASEKVEKPKHEDKFDDGIDFSAATSALSVEKEKIENAKKVVKSAIANETRRTNKNEV